MQGHLRSDDDFCASLTPSSWTAVLQLSCFDWGVFKQFCWDAACAASNEVPAAREHKRARTDEEHTPHPSITLAEAGIRCFLTRFDCDVVGSGASQIDEVLLLCRWLYGECHRHIAMCELVR
jgi:hypothetical protein